MTDFILMHLRRSLLSGRAYLILGLAMPLLVILLLYFTGRSVEGGKLGFPSSVGGGAVIVALMAPAVIPLATVIGSFSPLLLFVNDRSRGVHEYLLAFGKKPGDIFSALLVSVIVISAILVIVPITAVMVMLYISGPLLLSGFLLETAVYVVPMGFIVPLFISGIAAMWVSLTKRTQFVNSPIGIAPLFGLAPIMLVLMINEFVGPANRVILTGVITVLMTVATVAIFILASRLLSGERFIV